MIGNGFALMRDFHSIGTNYFRLVFSTVKPASHPSDLVADDVITGSYFEQLTFNWSLAFFTNDGREHIYIYIYIYQ